MKNYKVIGGNQPVLITGATGTGKSVFAKKIHGNSQQAGGPFIHVNIAAISEHLFESEIFGHCKGAFTNAFTAKAGFCATAGTGTLFLDEIGELSLQKQASLLSLIDERHYYPVGTSEKKHFLGSLIFETNKNHEQMVASGKFREHLYFRIRYLSYKLDPIAGNRLDLGHKIWAEINQKKVECNSFNIRFSSDLIESLKSYSWPGNYRELKNTIDYFFHLGVEQLEAKHLPYWIKTAGSPKPGNRQSVFRQALETFEMEFLRRELKRNQGKINQTALLTGINKVTLISKLKKYGIDRREYKFIENGRLAYGL
jgi:Nif-specific regulatory protein